MTRKNLTRALAGAVLATLGGLAQAQPLTETFTYQGRLADHDVPAEGLYDFQFRVFKDAAATDMIGAVITRSGVEVVDGLFTTSIDFGGSGLLFGGERRWLGVSVRPAGSGSYTALAPAQEITSAPHAIYSSYAGIAQIAETAMLDLTDAYRNGPVIDATTGPVSIIRSDGDPNNPAILRVGAESAGASGRFVVANSTGADAVYAGVSVHSDSGVLNVCDERGAPMLTSQMDSSAGGGGYLGVLRRAGSGVGSALGFKVDGNFVGTESTQVTIRGEANTMIFTTSMLGDDAVILPTSSISDAEIRDEPGVAEAANASAIRLIQDADVVDVIQSVTIDCPTSGYALVIATAEVSVAHVGGLISTADFGVSPTATAFQSNHDVELRLGNNLPTGPYDFPVTVHGVFPVFAGSNTFYFLGDQNSTSNSITVLDSQVTCVFLPTAYGSVGWESPQTPDTSPARVGGLTPLEIRREQDAAILDNERRIERELSEMRARIEHMERLLAEHEQP